MRREEEEESYIYIFSSFFCSANEAAAAAADRRAEEEIYNISIHHPPLPPSKKLTQCPHATQPNGKMLVAQSFDIFPPLSCGIHCAMSSRTIEPQQQQQQRPLGKGMRETMINAHFSLDDDVVVINLGEWKIPWLLLSPWAAKAKGEIYIYKRRRVPGSGLLMRYWILKVREPQTRDRATFSISKREKEKKRRRGGK